MENVTTTTQLGRPVNPESARQKRIAELAKRRENGELKRGRPIVEGSKRQINLALKEQKIQSGVELKRGRPINPESKRQVELAKKASK